MKASTIMGDFVPEMGKRGFLGSYLKLDAILRIGASILLVWPGPDVVLAMDHPHREIASQTHKSIQTPISNLPPAAWTLGGRASADDSDGYMDVLAPIVGNDSGFLFLNPRVSISDGAENEENVGLGIRKLVLNENAIIGGNIFYDARESSNDNRFQQMGLGLELLTEWMDARMNYYIPENDRELIESTETQDVEVETSTETGDPFFQGNNLIQEGFVETRTTTTTHHFDRFESAMEGLDFEIGFKVPWLDRILETRLFAGYYIYNSDFGEDLKGFKARGEIRASPGLMIDAEWYEDKALHGSDWYVGARVRLPFEIGNLFKGRNPFEGALEYFRRKQQPLKARMTDMVMRDIDVIIEESDFIEDLSRLRVETEIEREEFQVTLMDDIIFVDGDNSGYEDGTFEDPYNTIQEGVNASVSVGLLVHVADAALVYFENVVLADGVTLWGSGCVRESFDSGIQPTVDGQSKGPAITMSNDSKVWGFHIINSDLTGGVVDPAFERTIALSTYNIQRVGIYAENKTDLEISCNNLIEGNSEGILLAAEGISSFNSTIEDNVIQNNSGAGIWMIGKGSSGTLSSNMTGNSITGNADEGLVIVADQYDQISISAISNDFVGNGDDGIQVFLEDIDEKIDLDISNNLASFNGGAGIDVSAGGTALFQTLNLVINENEGNENADNNIEVEIAAANGNLFFEVNDNIVNDSALRGVNIAAVLSGGTGSIEGEVNRNEALSNDGTNIYVDLQSVDNDISVNISNNTANESETSRGIFLNGLVSNGTGRIVNAFLSENQVNDNEGKNIEVDLVTVGSDVNLSITQNQANNSQSDEGIEADIIAQGFIGMDVISNSATGNADSNVALTLQSTASDMNLEIGDNTADQSGNRGIYLIATVTGGPGSIQALIQDNESSQNTNENLGVILRSMNDNIALTATGNALNGSQNSAGLGIDARVLGDLADGGGNVTVDISDNLDVEDNRTYNIFLRAFSMDGNVAMNVENNMASGAVEQEGIYVESLVSSGVGAVSLNILNNTALDSGGASDLDGIDSGIEANLISSNSDLTLNIMGNEAGSSVMGGGILAAGVVTGSGGSVVSSIEDNITIGGSNDGLSLSLTSLNDMDIIISGNTSSENSARGMDITLNGATLGNGTMNLDLSSNTVIDNVSEGINLEASTSLSGEIAATISMNVIIGNGVSETFNADALANSGMVVSLQSVSGGIDFSFSENTASGNGSANTEEFGAAVAGSGIDLSLVSQSGNILGTVMNNTAISNGTAITNDIGDAFGGSGMSASFVTETGVADVVVTGNTVDSNGLAQANIGSASGGRGLSAGASGDVSTLEVSNNVISDNGFASTPYEFDSATGGTGLNIILTSQTGLAQANIMNNLVSYNGFSQTQNDDAVGGDGILANFTTVNGGSIEVNITDNNVQNNGSVTTVEEDFLVEGGSGVKMAVGADSTIANIDITVQDNILSQNAGSGFETDISPISITNLLSLDLSRNTSHQNGESGFMVTISTTGGGVDLKLDENTSNENTQIGIGVQADLGDSMLLDGLVQNNVTNDNGNSQSDDGDSVFGWEGLLFTLSTVSGDMSMDVLGNSAARNGQVQTTAGGTATGGIGILLDMNSQTGDMNASISSNTLQDNGNATASGGDIAKAGAGFVAIMDTGGIISADIDSNIISGNAVAQSSEGSDAIGGLGMAVTIQSVQATGTFTNNVISDNGLGEAATANLAAAGAGLGVLFTTTTGDSTAYFDANTMSGNGHAISNGGAVVGNAGLTISQNSISGGNHSTTLRNNTADNNGDATTTAGASAQGGNGINVSYGSGTGGVSFDTVLEVNTATGNGLISTQGGTNVIAGNGISVSIASGNPYVIFSALIADNTVSSNGGISDASFDQSRGDGLRVSIVPAVSGSTVDVTFSQNTSAFNGENGLTLEVGSSAVPAGSVDAALTANTTEDNDGDGLDIVINSSDTNLTIANNTSSRNGVIQSSDGGSVSGSSGMSIEVITSDDISAVITGNTIADNGSAMTTNGGDATAGAGLEATFSGSSISSVIEVEVSDNTVSNNGSAHTLAGGQSVGGVGLGLMTAGFSSTVTMTNNTVSSNGFATSDLTDTARASLGIDVFSISYAGDNTIIIQNNTANENGSAMSSGGWTPAGSGININVVTLDGGNLFADISNNTANENGDATTTAGADFFGGDGINLGFSNEASGGNMTVTVMGNTAVGNGLVTTDTLAPFSYPGSGILAVFTPASPSVNITANFINNTANYNGLSNLDIADTNGANGAGLSVQLALSGTGSGLANALFQGNTADNNGVNGIFFSAGDGSCCTDDFSVAFTGNRSSGNGDDGIDISIFGVDTNLTAFGNVASTNGSDGIELSVGATGGGSAVVNFGDASAGTQGYNSLFDNADFGMNQLDLLFFPGILMISAENNYWNTDPTQDPDPATPPPALGDEYNQGTGIIDADPFLTSDPNP